MKIAIINNLYPPFDRGGAEQVVVRSVQGLLEAGHEVVVVTACPNGAYTEKNGKLTVYRSKPKNLFFYTNARYHSWPVRLLWHVLDIFNWGTAYRVRNILKKEKPDIVHTHTLMGLSFLIPLVIRRLGLRHIHTIHDVQLVEPSAMIIKSKEKSWRYTGLPSRVYTALMKKMVGSPAVVLSPSNFLLDFYLSRGFFRGSQTFVLRNPATFFVSIKNQNIKNECLRFLYVGQVEEHKGARFLAESFASWREKEKIPAELRIVGDGSLLNDLKQKFGGREDMLICGRVKHEDLPDFYSSSDMVVVPSLCYENSPTVIFESLFFGVPVLASRIEGISELIKEGENGFTFAAGDGESLIEKLSWCAKNRETLFSLREKARVSQPVVTSREYVEKLLGFYLSVE